MQTSRKLTVTIKDEAVHLVQKGTLVVLSSPPHCSAGHGTCQKPANACVDQNAAIMKDYQAL